MLRYGLVNYLLFVLAAGPWFCCCTMNQITDRVSSLFATEQDAAEKCSCCQNQHQSSGNSTHENDGSNDRAPARPNQCPCEEERPEFADKVNIDVQNSRVVQAGTWLHLDDVVFDLPDLHSGAAAENTRPVRNYLSHFRICSAQGLLNILQTFRC